MPETADHDASAAMAASLARVHALRDTLAAQGPSVRLVETHISWVLLAGEHAYKLKKPLHLPFLDFRSLQARRAGCAEELRLNRRLAPRLYLDCMALRDPGQGEDAPVADVALRMRRFPDGALWTERLAAGCLGTDEVDAFAERLAAFHAAADVVPAGSAYGGAAQQRRTLATLLAGLDTWCGTGPQAGPWSALRTWLLDQVDALAPLWARRCAAGRVREGHGDLHLANIITLEDGPTAFDALEFDPALRWIDVLHDLAFAVADLLAHGAPALAWRLLDRYLEQTGDHDGVPALRYYLVCRALVRAQVAAIRAAQPGPSAAGPDAQAYLATALRLADEARARLAITAGLPGSGKSHVALQLVQAAGALRLRSDVERKRLFGLAARASSAAHVPGGIYHAEATTRTYARLRALAALALRAGWPVVVDAAFLRAGERASFAALAAERGVPFTMLWCEAPLPVLRERILARQARGGDASEADLAVLERLLSAAELPGEAERAQCLVADGGPGAEELAARWLQAR